MNKHPLYSMGFDDAVLRELSIERDSEEIKQTSVYLPRWLHTTVAILNAESKMSVAKLYFGIVNHGTAILQHRFDDEIDAIKQIRRMIFRSGDDFAEDFLYDFKSLGDREFKKPYKRTVGIPVWAVGYLGEVSAVFPIEYSAALRLTMCYSLNTWMDIDKRGKRNCVIETKSFENGINRYTDFCNLLTG